VIDGVVPPHGVLPYMVERMLVSLDMQMEVAFHAKERATGDWKSYSRRQMQGLNSKMS
jgi:hypothetical protein